MTPDTEDSTADSGAAVARVLEWLPGLNTPLTWETFPARHADAHTPAGEEDGLCCLSAEPLVGSDLPSP